MPKSGDSQTEQIKKLKEMVAQNEELAARMRELIAELESKTNSSRDKKREN